MANAKSVLLEQFSHCYDENGWFVAVRNAVEGVTTDQAEWKPDGSDHSIRELIAHLRYDVNVYLQRLKGVDYRHTAADNDETFLSSEENWQAELELFDAVLGELRELIKSIDESKFDEPVLGNEKFTWAEIIAELNAHNAYHGGQIVLIRKLQTSWDANKGVS